MHLTAQGKLLSRSHLWLFRFFPPTIHHQTSPHPQEFRFVRKVTQTKAKMLLCLVVILLALVGAQAQVVRPFQWGFTDAVSVLLYIPVVIPPNIQLSHKVYHPCFHNVSHWRS